MRNFNRDNRSGGGSGGRGFGGRDSGRPSMHKATCSECGQECEIPFRPTGDRPVFCSSCFGKQQGSSSAGRSGGKSFGRPSFHDRRPSFGDKQMYEAVCDKCGNKCEVPFRPTGGKPVYCNQCFDKGGRDQGKGAGPSQEQFKILNDKLDKILKVLVPAVSIESVPEVKTKKKIKEVKKNKDILVKTKAVSKKAKTKKKK